MTEPVDPDPAVEGRAYELLAVLIEKGSKFAFEIAERISVVGALLVAANISHNQGLRVFAALMEMILSFWLLAAFFRIMFSGRLTRLFAADAGQQRPNWRQILTLSAGMGFAVGFLLLVALGLPELAEQIAAAAKPA